MESYWNTRRTLNRVTLRSVYRIYELTDICVELLSVFANE